MRLTDLEPQWVFDFNRGAMKRATSSHLNVHYSEPPEYHEGTLTIENAQGVLFLCPVCFKKNGGPVGTESVLCWFKGHGVPDDAKPGPGRWTASGTDFNDLTLSPSINVDHEHWHGWIKNGEVT